MSAEQLTKEDLLIRQKQIYGDQTGTIDLATASLLGISQSTTPNEIRKQFRDITRRLHPDVNNNILPDDQNTLVIAGFTVGNAREKCNKYAVGLETDIKNKKEEEDIRVRLQSRRDAKLKAEATKVRIKELQEQEELLQSQERQATADRVRKERDNARAAYIAEEQAKSLRTIEELLENLRPRSMTPDEEVTLRPIDVLDPIGNRPDFYQSTKVESSQTSDRLTQAHLVLEAKGIKRSEPFYVQQLEALTKLPLDEIVRLIQKFTQAHLVLEAKGIKRSEPFYVQKLEELVKQ